MKMRYILVACVMLCADASAIDFSNGCGSGWNQPVVPDSPIGYEFKKACDAHDNCYSRCLKGGENDGSSVKCDQTPSAKEERRTHCDNDFLLAINQICERYPTGTICRLLGKIYFAAVRLGGGGSFNGYEIQALIERLQANPEFDTTMLEKRLDAAIKEKENLSNVKIQVSLSKDAALAIESVQSPTSQGSTFKIENLRKDTFELKNGTFNRQSR